MVFKEFLLFYIFRDKNNFSTDKILFFTKKLQKFSLLGPNNQDKNIYLSISLIHTMYIVQYNLKKYLQ